MSDVLTESSESIYQAVYSALESTSKSNHPLVGSESLIHRRTRSRSFHPYSAAAATEDLLEMLLIQEQEEERRAKIVRAVVGETLKASKFVHGIAEYLSNRANTAYFSVCAVEIQSSSR